MSRTTRGIMVLVMAAVGLVALYECGVCALWIGFRDVRVRIQSSRPVRSAACSSGISRRADAVAFRDVVSPLVESEFKAAGVISHNAFRIDVQTTGSKSPMGIAADSFIFQKYRVVWIELDDGECWSVVLELPDDLRGLHDAAVSVAIPGPDARLIPPSAPKP